MKYEVTGANRDTGAEIKIIVEATDFHHAEQQANDLGIMVSEVRKVHEQGQTVPSAAAPAPAMPTRRGATCQACGSYPLYRRRVYRMSGPVVVIGYILLIPSILGILLNGLLLLSPVLGSGPAGVANLVYIEQLQQAGVDQDIIDKVINNQRLTQQEKYSLTPQQNDAVRSVELSQAGTSAGTCCAFGLVGGTALIGMVLCFVSGLLGWLLVMKKKILQCPRCHAVLSAS